MSDLTDPLRSIAGNATPGPWRCPAALHHVVDLVRGVRYERKSSRHEADGWQARNDSTHIATFDPSLVTAMLDVIDSVDELLEVADGPCRYDHHGYCQAHYLDDPCRVAVARTRLARLREAADRNAPAAEA